MPCEYCKYCRFPRSANDNNGSCKCKIMKNKTIDVYVSGVHLRKRKNRR